MRAHDIPFVQKVAHESVLIENGHCRRQGPTDTAIERLVQAPPG